MEGVAEQNNLLIWNIFIVTLLITINTVSLPIDT